MEISSSRLKGYYAPGLAFVGAVIVGVATMTGSEHSKWNLVGALLAACGAFLAAREQTQQGKGLTDLITGGDSFAYIDFLNANAGPQSRLMCVHHRGQFPLADLSVVFLDVPLLLQNPPSGQPPVLKSLVLGNLNLDDNRFINTVVFPDNGCRFQLIFKAKNGSWNETVLAERVGDGLTFAIQVWRTSFETNPATRINMSEKVDPNFPRSTGEIDWSFGQMDISS